MTPEEQLLDELLDETKPGSINQTIKVYPDASRIDATKTSGREHRTLLATIITRVKAWVVVLLAGKSDTGHGHTIGEVYNLQTTLNSHNQRITKNEQDIATLQANPGGTTINSTDDIQNEGTVNKWWTEPRTYLSKAAGYVIQGTARAITESDSLMMILGIFENRINLNATAISQRVRQIVQGGITYTPDANGSLVLPAR